MARSLLFAAVACLLSCSGSRASIEIEDAHATWVNLAVNRHVFIDVDVLAHDQLGGSIGQYCFTVVIPFQDTLHDICNEDLSDGDRKTVRIESGGDVGDGVAIGITLRHAGLNIGRDLIGPVTPH